MSNIDNKPTNNNYTDKRKLMISFVIKKKIKNFISFLHENNVAEKIFILSNNKHEKIYLVSFNILNEIDLSDLRIYGVLNTFSIQRNKETNTLYSINALNMLLQEQSMITEKSRNEIKLDWKEYKDSLITTSDGNINLIKTKLVKMIRFTPNFNINRVKL